MSLDRDGLEGRLDPSALRERLDDLYVRYFMPPSVTEDSIDVEAATGPDEGAVDLDAFDFAAWLQAGRETGPTPPPAEPRVVTGAAETAEPTPTDFESFDFTGWLSDGEAYEPVDVLGSEPDAVTEADTDLAPGADRPHLPRAPLHPVKAATFALFLSVVALVGLTVVGYLPALGPATGLGP